MQNSHEAMVQILEQVASNAREQDSGSPERPLPRHIAQP